MTEGLFYVDGLTHVHFQMRLSACKNQQPHPAFSLKIKKKNKKNPQQTTQLLLLQIGSVGGF